MNWIGVLLAAGRGRRMGGTKQLVPWTSPDGATTTLAGAAFDAIAPACATMVVVVGHETERVTAALAPRSMTTVTVDPDADMFESVRAGLQRAAARWPEDGVLLHPADHPHVERATLDMLTSRPGSTAHLAEFEGRGGHPAAIPPAVRDAIVRWNGDGGLRAFWEAHPHRCVRHPVDDASVVRDIDTPEDLPARNERPSGEGRS